MAIPIVPILLLFALAFIFALKRELFIKAIIQIGMDILFGIIFTALFYLFVPIPAGAIMWVVFGIAGIFFIVSLFIRKDSQGAVNKALYSQP